LAIPVKKIDALIKKDVLLDAEQSEVAPYKVLIVEDNELVLKVLDIRLKNKGVIPTCIDDSRKALEIINKESFDLVVLDLVMPGLSGLDLLKKIRAKYTPMELPIIMISEAAQEDNLVNCLEEGANDFIKKPINFTVAWARSETLITIKRFNDEVEKRRKDIVRTASMKLVLEMASTISHEIINPLTVVDGRIEFLRSRIAQITFSDNDLKIKNEILSDLDNIQNSILRTESVVEGLRAFAVDSSKERIKTISFPNLKTRVHSICNGLLMSQGVEFKMGESDLKFKAKESAVLQAIFNLVMNSRREIADLDNPIIEITAEKKDDKTGIIRIKDSGKGIKPEIAEEIFTPFFTTNKDEKSSGMGLSISKENLEELGGTLYYNKESPNTEFVIELPLSGTDDSEK
jgi:signal transduction histidine kinase